MTFRPFFALAVFMLGVNAFALPKPTVPTRAATPPASIVNVLTQRNDNARSGANLKEIRLNTRNVNAKTFGKLWTRQVDGEVYAQPLYVSGLKVNGKLRNVLYVATEHNSVYAFDADDPEAWQPLWKVNFGPTVPVSEIGQNCGSYRDMSSEAGITGTPVIDLAGQTLYVVARNRSEARVYSQSLHALDLVTGKERLNSPVVIAAKMPGRGAGNVNGTLAFDPHIQNQRASLLLSRGIVYITWASHCDTGDYHGWILGYNARTLQQRAIYNTTPNGWAGGVWQSGTGISADAKGNLYMAVGNGTFTIDQGGEDIGDSFLKLGTGDVAANSGLAKLKRLDYFTPHDQEALLRDDADLGSTGALLLHDERLIIGGNKRGTMFVLRMDEMGGYDRDNNSKVAQSFAGTPGGHFHGTPVYWKSDVAGPLVYAWGEQDFLKARKILGNRLVPQPLMQSQNPAPPGMPGGFLSISAHGGKAGTGILWASLPAERDANQAVVPGVLRAFDAADVKRELWNSLQNPARDDLGNFPKFCQPTIVNGRVYMATFSNQIVCYGLNPPSVVKAPLVSPPQGKAGALVTLSGGVADVLRYTIDGRDPQPNDAIYRAPFRFKGNGQVRVRAFHKGFAPSPVTTAFFAEDSFVGNGDGLSAQYFPGRELAGVGIQRTDTTVDVRAPADALKLKTEDEWSARWTGRVQAQYNDEYTFYTVSDDGVRLWVNGKLLIDDWGDHPATEDRATLRLERGKRYDIKLEYYNAGGGAECHLLWSTPASPRVLVPQSQLYSR